MFVRAGEKVVRGPNYSFTISSGSIGLLPPRTVLTIENRPGPDGLYLANAMVLDPRLFSERGRRKDLPVVDPFPSTANNHTIAAFERAALILDDPTVPLAIQDHAVCELLLWLEQDGIGFRADQPPTFLDRLRSILTAEPDAEWRVADAARILAVSDATLRRRLASKGTSFSDMLMDVRMTHALGLLQTTELPINQIALDCGYQSPSRFSVRFRKRFGISPSAIRTQSNEQNGTENDRIGTAS